MRPRDCCKIWPRIGLLVFGAAVWIARLASAGAAGQAADYLGPWALAVAPGGERLYVACADARQVLWLALPGGNVIRRVDVPAEPTGLALTPDAMKLIVTCAAPRSTVIVMDAGTGRLLSSIPSGHTAMSPTVSPDGRRLYVCNRFDNDVSVIDLPAARPVRRVAAVREPIAAALTPDGRTLLVANHLPNTRTNIDLLGEVRPVVTVVDTRTFATDAILLPSGANSLRGLCITPDGLYAFVTHLLSNFQEIPFRLATGWINTNVVSIIDMRRRKVVATIGLDEMDLGAANPWDVIGVGGGQLVCVSLAGTHELSVIGRAGLLGEFARRTMQPMMGVWPIYTSLGASLWRRYQLPGKGPRGLAAAGSKVYVAEYFSDTVAVVDLKTAGSPHTIALGPSPKLTPRRRGQLLFHDATICYQHWQSCASCHPDGRADALNWDLMNDGSGNAKNTKSLLLAYQTPPAMARGVRPSAQQAVRSGLVNILFTHRPDADAAAIDAYLSALEPVPSPHLVDGRLSPAAERGRQLFHSRQAGCYRCHPAPLYTDLKMHNVGTGSRSEQVKRFDTPTLIEVWRTAPYLHDGRYTTVQQLLIEGRHGLNRRRAAALSRQQLEDLAQFVLSL